MRAEHDRQKPARGHKHSESDAAWPDLPGLRPGQSVGLLQALHILTRDGRLNQDSRRKFKQVMHLVQLIEPLLDELTPRREGGLTLADHGAPLAFASDWPVTDVNVMRGIQAALTRKPYDGGQDQRVGLMQVLRLMWSV